MHSAAELLISSDSHVVEPTDLWVERLPQGMRDQAPRYPRPEQFQAHSGGQDPVVRVKEMAVDGVSAELLYTSLGLNQFGIKDAALQEACFRVYNDWLFEYCSHAGDRLFGIGLISVYDIDKAVKEVHRCKKAGMRGLMIWQVPPDELSFATSHYDPFWAAAQDLELPVSLHILTGAPYGPGMNKTSEYAAIHLQAAVNIKLLYAMTALLQIIATGVLERFPRLKIVLVENEMSWLPFVVSQWDKYRQRRSQISPMTMLPGEYFKRQVYATFFNDPPARMLLGEWGTDNCMWSNDFPHQNSTWPKSREVIERDLGHISDAGRAKLLHQNVTRLYNLPALPALSPGAA